MTEPHTASVLIQSTAQSWARVGTIVVILMASILAPFALWGDLLDAQAPLLLEQNQRPLAIAVIGISLLIADVVLPIPSSVVGIAMCWLLGPWWGGVALAVGLTLSFVCGYGLGWAVPEPRLRAWVGAAVWDGVREHAQAQALWWIVIARPLPMLAEMTAILAGVWRIPPLIALPLAALSSIAVASLYAVSVWLGLSTPGVLPALAATICLPTVMWLLHRSVMKRALRAKSSR